MEIQSVIVQALYIKTGAGKGGDIVDAIQRTPDTLNPYNNEFFTSGLMGLYIVIEWVLAENTSTHFASLYVWGYDANFKTGGGGGGNIKPFGLCFTKKNWLEQIWLCKIAQPNGAPEHIHT